VHGELLSLQGMLLQQFAAVVHSWPYKEHAGALESMPPPPSLGTPVSPLEPPSLPPVPPSPPAPPHGPQTPLVLAGAMTQLEPGQQSALVLQSPQVGTHWFEKQTNGGPEELGFGTHGAPLQQSALEAHEPPGLTHCDSLQRGTPRLSCLQVSSFSQLPLQQSHDALHEVVASLQTAPFGLQPVGFWQTPTVLGGTIPQVDGPPWGMFGLPTDPQQSVSFVQRSPTT
jgi:hypothetical protein